MGAPPPPHQRPVACPSFPHYRVPCDRAEPETKTALADQLSVGRHNHSRTSPQLLGDSGTGGTGAGTQTALKLILKSITGLTLNSRHSHNLQ